MTHVIRLLAPIGDHRPSISMGEVAHAVAPRVPVGDGLLMSLEPQDGSDDLYQQGADLIARKVPGFIEHRVNTSDTNHLSLFGFAPMPLLMLLGRTLGDKQPAEVYERHRHSDSWRWDEDGPLLDWSAQFPSRPVPGRDVALLLSISATIAIEGVKQILADGFDVVEIALPKLQRVTNIVRTRAQLRGFAEVWRSTLNRIKDEYDPQCVHVFPAAPLSVCLELGRRLLPKADPEMIIYDRFGAQFRRALSLRGPELPSLAPAAPTVLEPIKRWVQALHAFFVSSFKPSELQRWLDHLESGLSDHILPDQVSRHDFADSALKRLQERGLIDEQFFGKLAGYFPSPIRKAQVEAIRDAWCRERSAST